MCVFVCIIHFSYVSQYGFPFAFDDQEASILNYT